MNFSNLPGVKRRNSAKLLRKLGFVWLIGHGLFIGGLQHAWVLPVLVALFGAAEIVDLD